MNRSERTWTALLRLLRRGPYSSSLDRLDDRAQADAIAYRLRSGL